MLFINISPVWILIASLYRIGPARALGLHQKPPVLLAKAGDAVTLLCTFEEHMGNDQKVWYKQRVGQALQTVGTVILNLNTMIFPEFNRSGIKLKANRSSISLTIPHTTKDDEGMYFCGLVQLNTVKFSTGTFLAVGELNISVLQSPASASVPPGEWVTLQCSVLSEIRAAELRVLWFRAAAGPSSPEIIYTHQSSRQCEISSSTHSCVNTFSKNVLSENDTGTFYCAVATCGKILLGNGTKVVLAKSVAPIVMYLGTALGLCVVVISAQAILNCKRTKCEDCSEGSVLGTTARQDHDAVELNYVVKKLRMKRGSPDSVFSEVGYFTVTDHRQSLL